MAIHNCAGCRSLEAELVSLTQRYAQLRQEFDDVKTRFQIKIAEMERDARAEVKEAEDRARWEARDEFKSW